MVVVQTGDAGYTNQPSIHAQARWRVRLESHARRQATGRAVDRMLLALRGIRTARATQSGTSRLASRPGAPTSTTRPRHRPAAAVTTPRRPPRDGTLRPSATPRPPRRKRQRSAKVGPETTTEIDHARAAMSSTSRIKLPGTAAPTAFSFRKQVSARFAPRPLMRAAGEAAGRPVPACLLSTGVQAV